MGEASQVGGQEGGVRSGGSELAGSTASDLGLGRQLGLDSCSWPPPLMGLRGLPCSRLTPSPLRRLLLPTRHGLRQAWMLLCASVGGVFLGAEVEGVLSTRRAPRTEPRGVSLGAGSAVLPGASAVLAASAGRFPANGAPETARAQAASFPPSLRPGTSWAGLQPWELRRLLLFFLLLRNFSLGFNEVSSAPRCLVRSG